MKAFKTVLILSIATMSLHSSSYYSKELREELNQWKKEKMLRDARKNALAYNEISVNGVAFDVPTLKQNACKITDSFKTK